MLKLISSILIFSFALISHANAENADYGNQAPAANQASHSGKDCGPCESSSWNPDYAEQLLDTNTKKTDAAIVAEILAENKGSRTTPGSSTEDK